MFNMSIFFLIYITFFSFLFSQNNSFVVIIPSYNNEKWCIKNLESIINQNHSDFRIIYINDCSIDKTKELVLSYFNKKNIFNSVLFVDNTVRLGALNNLYTAIHSCKDEEIVVIVDGDDWLYDNNVFSKLNKIYNEKKPLLTYGQFIYLTTGKVGFCKQYSDDVIQKQNFRYCNWNSSHLKTFKAHLFKKIKKEDLMYKSKFFDMACDLAFMFPMLEMARDKIYFVPDILYVYNNSNPINDFYVNQKRQKFLEKIIKKRPKYN